MSVATGQAVYVKGAPESVVGRCRGEQDAATAAVADEAAWVDDDAPG